MSTSSETGLVHPRPGRPHGARRNLGSYLVPAWDAVLLADAVVRKRPPNDQDYLTSFELKPTALATGALAVVRRGRLEKPPIAVQLWHVDPLNDPSRVWERPSAGLVLGTKS